MSARLLLLLFLTLLPPQLSAAAPMKARSLSGNGLLLFGSETRSGQALPVLYREPGIGRIAALDVAQLPRIYPPLTAFDGVQPVIVTVKKLGWYRVIYDHGERQGWLQGRPALQYLRWAELLPGRIVALPAGLRPEFYQLRSEPDPAAKTVATINKESRVSVLTVAGDWISIRHGAGVTGWLRWRDDNDRLLISVTR